MDDPNHGPAIDVASIRWERTGLHLDARPAAGTPIDPATLRLASANGSGSLPPTGATVEDGLLRIRINVMQGADLQPLTPGRWVLGVVGRAPAEASSASVPLRVADPDAIDPRRHAMSFRVRRGVFHATPTVAVDGALALDIAFDPGAGFDADAGRLGETRLRVGRHLSDLRGAALRVLVRAIKVLPGRARRRILFSSASPGRLTGNLQVVHDRMVERGLDRAYRIATVSRSGDGGRRWLDRVRLPWLLATADVIVIDDFQPAIYRMGMDPAVRIIQLWHASGAFKTVGYSRVGKPGGPDPWSRVHKNYTYAIVSSTNDAPFYAEAFGIPESRMAPTGIPRMDRFFDDEARAAGLRAAHEAFPASEGRFTILFAPTFRGETARNATYDLGRLDWAALHALCVEKDAVMIVRMHPFVTAPLGIPAALTDRLLDGSTTTIDVNDLLFAVDLLITDYSSIVFEFSTLHRPMLFYAWDLDEYVAERDFYVPFEEFVPGRIVRTLDELVDTIRRDDYDAGKVAEFAARHFAHLDGGSTDRVIDELIIAP
jgi:CDP-ribitol ribitolphosphotransferase / teichoic acid ribitol-phosphate polymerase